MYRKTLIILICFYSLLLNAQNQTPYQVKVEQLSRDFYKDVGLDKNIINKIIKDDNDLDSVLLLDEVRYKFSYFASSDYGKIRILKFESDMQDAKKLKNKIDIENDLKNKQKKEQETKLILEKKREIELKDYYEKSDFVSIQKRIKSDFENWLTKSEFEKNIEYENRIKKSAQVFDSISYNVIQEKIAKYKLNNNIKIELQNYDAEKELYYLKLLINNTIVNNTIKIKPSDAEFFKNIISNRHELNLFPESSEKWFLKNYNLCPPKLQLEITDNEILSIEISFDEGDKHLNFNTADLDILKNTHKILSYNNSNYIDHKKKQSSDDYNLYIDKAISFRKSNDFYEALKYFELAYEINPNKDLTKFISELKKDINDINEKKVKLENLSNSISNRLSTLNRKSNELKKTIESSVNKKASQNYSDVISFLSNNLQKELTLKETFQNLKNDDIKWTNIHEDSYLYYLNLDKEIKIWENFNDKINRLYYNGSLDFLKDEKNPEVLLSKILKQ